MQRKCMSIWTDPANSTQARLGPYMCGRRLQHEGPHARLGVDGSFAVWAGNNQLLLAAQTVAGSTEEALDDLAT